jgi:DNA polymerase I
MIQIKANPQLSRTMTEITVRNGNRETMLKGPERNLLADLFDRVKVYDPDIILFPDADLWVPRMVIKAEKCGLDPSLSRTGWFRYMASRSYFSYGQAEAATETSTRWEEGLPIHENVF